MSNAQLIGLDFRLFMQEEARQKNGGRVTEEFLANSDRMGRFREEALALDDRNYRIPDKRPQLLMEECSLREMAAECIVDRQGNPVGEGFIEEMFRPTDQSQRAHLRMTRMREAGDISAVDYTMFAGITGQLLINSTLQGWEHEEFKLTQQAGVYNTQFVDGETVPGVSLPYTKDMANANDDLLLVKPQQPFPYLTMAENYKRLPSTEMRGAIMGVDRLSIYGDRTGLVAKNAAGGAYILGVAKEQRGLRMLIGADSVPYIEKYAFDSAPIQIDAYQAAAGSASTQLASTTHSTRPFPFVNDIPSNPLTDYHAFETADQAASKVVDPNNGLPVQFRLPTLFACYTERFNIAVVMQAFNTWRISAAANGLAGTGGVATVGPNPVTTQLGEINVQVSKMLRQQMIASGLYGDATAGGTLSANADKVWFYGNFKEALKYSTNWNIKVIMAPANSEAEFTQDIVLRWRYDERGRWAWHEPRLIQRHDALQQS